MIADALPPQSLLSLQTLMDSRHTVQAAPCLRERERDTIQHPGMAVTGSKTQCQVQVIQAEISSTFQRVTRQAQLVDDIAWNVRLDALANLGMTLRRLQQVVKLFRVKLLSTAFNTH